MTYDPKPMLSRRTMLAGVSAIAATASLSDKAAQAASVAPDQVERMLGGRSLRFVDLTHALTDAFDFTPRSPRITMEEVQGSGAAAGMRMHRVHIIEHTGTHIDAPSHFDPQGRDLGRLPIDDLVVPLAIIDVRDRGDPDAMVDLAGIAKWETAHGRFPEGCCVAMYSGYDPITALTRRPGASGKFTSAGFGEEATRFLIDQRDVKGIAVDTMSLDAAPNMPAYPVHRLWLQSGRWGIEGLGNLDRVPPSGALISVGAPPLSGASGLPIRAMAIF